MHKLKNFLLPLTLTALLTSSPLTQAALMFNFDFSDNGTGFNDATLGTARQAALVDAGNLLSAYFTNYNATVDISVTSYTGSTSGGLASAGSSFFTSPGIKDSSVQTKILSNGATDITGSSSDGFINWNFAHDWDLDDSISSGSFDFKAVAMHELLHTLGYLSLINENGQGLGNSTAGSPDAYSTYDSFLVDSDGNPLINGSSAFDLNQLADLTGGTGANGIFFNGANAVAANGGNLVNIYSPTTFNSGSSLSHIDTEFFTSDQFISEHAVPRGALTRNLSSIEIGILQDIGYTQINNVTPVPVPAAFWLLASGIFVLIKRRRV